MRASVTFSMDSLAADEHSVDWRAIKCKVAGFKKKKKSWGGERQTSALPYARTDGHTQGARLFGEMDG